MLRSPRAEPNGEGRASNGRDIAGPGGALPPAGAGDLRSPGREVPPAAGRGTRRAGGGDGTPRARGSRIADSARTRRWRKRLRAWRATLRRSEARAAPLRHGANPQETRQARPDATTRSGVRESRSRTTPPDHHQRGIRRRLLQQNPRRRDFGALPVITSITAPLLRTLRRGGARSGRAARCTRSAPTRCAPDARTGRGERSSGRAGCEA
jgi:hypothetical protein